MGVQMSDPEGATDPTADNPDGLESEFRDLVGTLESAGCQLKSIDRSGRVTFSQPSHDPSVTHDEANETAHTHQETFDEYG